MVTLAALWLPILVSAVLVFFASSLLRVVFRHHATDYAPLPDEAAVGEALRRGQVEPGDYVMPFAATAEERASPEYTERLTRGPVALLTVRRAGPINMVPQLAGWFLFVLVVTGFAGFLATQAASAGTGAIFRITATAALLAYAVGTWSESIWFGRKWSTPLKNTADGVIFALITGGVFIWLWPG